MPSSSAPHDPAPAAARAEAPSLYALLGVTPTASAEQLRQSFRRLSKLYHPDTTTLPAVEAAQAFARLRQAYAVLGDPQARRLYDGRRLAPPPGPQPRPIAPASIRRSLSGGEWFALLLLAMALVLSLVLGIGVAWARGAELVRWPSWWTDLHPAPPAGPLDLAAGGGRRGTAAGGMVESTPTAAPLATAPHGPSP
ncbi:MAG: J domain-containing protein [Cyanobacteriota bacterium]|jgi:hypothetical protein